MLGVPRTESPHGIRAAYRALAKKLHPDVAGEHTTRAFQEITEAYGVLSDPARRQDYDSELGRTEPSMRSYESPPTSRRSDAEPLIPRRGTERPTRFDTLDFDVRLTPEEAAHGCVVPIGIPVPRRCPICRGSGGDFWPCTTCRARGVIASEQRFGIRVPPLSQPRALLELVVRRAGAHDLHLRLHLSRAA
jgi:DnaJ-class molecular chaperone